MEDALLRVVDACDLFGDDRKGGLSVAFTSHDYMPPFDSHIRELIRAVFPTLDKMKILSF